MNNTRYPDMICDFLPILPEGKRVGTMSLSYVKEAALGDTFTVFRAPMPDTPDAFLVRTKREDGQVCLDASVTLENI
jgi:acyl-ACP thioesterase